MNCTFFIFQDWSSNHNNTKGKLITLLFRVASCASTSKFLALLLIPYLVFYKVFVEWVLGIEIPYNTLIGKGLVIYHGQALVIHSKTKIGESCIIRQSTTIGNNGLKEGCPTIGDNVNIGANVCIIGPVIIGNNVTIGAGCVVTKSIPSHSVVVGNPARIIR